MNPPDPLKPEDMLQEPLLTEDGLINPVCMAELSVAIASLPPTHIRLSGNEEWSSRKDHWVFRSEIVGAFAQAACRQSPYGVPDGLENVCKYLNACLKTIAPWNSHGMVEASLCDINRWLHEILMDQNLEEFDAWNRCRKGKTPDVAFASSYDRPADPDYDFIDLHALLHNVCLTIRDERRKNAAFDKKFEADEIQTG